MNVQLKTINAIFNPFIKFILLLVVISVFVPLSPKMPASSLDASWAVGLNQAVVQGLSFGKELIFTLGPYASIYTKTYHPALDSLMIAGSLYLAVAYWLCLIFLMKDMRWYWPLTFCFLLFIMIYARDSLFFSYPLLVGLLCFKTIHQEKPFQIPHVYFSFLTILLFIPFGLFALIKGSVLTLCVTISILCFIYLLANNRKTLALISLITPLISMVFFWSIIGQSINHLPLYFLNMLSLISSFTEAMSTEGDMNEVILFLINTLLLLGTIVWQKQIKGTKKIFLLTLFFVFLLLSFKAGFARHYGHAFIPGTSILIAALLLPFILNTKVVWAIILFSLNTWYYINNHYNHLSIRDNFISNYSATWHGLKNRLSNAHGLEQDFNLAMDYLSKQAAFPILSGTTDIYSYNQSYLIASKNHWFPRPVFQSYSVFNAKLALKNKKYLQSTHRPDNIIFKIEPIDGRVPALEDGPSWPELLNQYQPTQLMNDFLFLHKKTASNQVKKSMEQLSSEQHYLEELVRLPDLNGLIYAEIELKPTLLGHLTTLLFKPAELHIIFTLKNGTKKQFRLIANMMKAGFLISPLIENTTEFTLLYSQKNYLDEKMVQSFVIATNQQKNWQWNDEYTVHLKRIYHETR